MARRDRSLSVAVRCGWLQTRRARKQALLCQFQFDGLGGGVELGDAEAADLAGAGGSRLAGADDGSAPCFHLAESMAVSCREIDLGARPRATSSALASTGSRQMAITPSPSSTLAFFWLTSTSRPLTVSPVLCSAMYSSIEVGSSCFIPSRMRRLARSTSRTCARTRWPTVRRLPWVLEALLAADVADVDHALDALAQFDEGAEIGQTHHRAFHGRRPRRTSWRRLVPGVAQSLLQARARSACRRPSRP